MLNFMRRDQRKLFAALLRAWTLSSATLPWIIPALFALLIAWAASLLGECFTVALADFVADIRGDWLQLFVHLWLAAYFMAALFYGVGRELIGHSARNPLSAPLANMAALLRKWSRFLSGALASRSPVGAAMPAALIAPRFLPDSIGLSPPVALLAGASPQLE